MPFVRLIVPFIIGIIVQFYCSFPLRPLVVTAIAAMLAFAVFHFLRLALQYKLRWLPGISLYLLVALAGTLLIYNKDIRKSSNWIGRYNADSIAVLATLEEPLVEKAKSYKAEASIEAVSINGEWRPVRGKALLYFGKDSTVVPSLTYGSQVVFTKPLQAIKNSGNPGNFDYKQYNAFQDIYHQVFLKPNEYAATNTVHVNGFKKWLFGVRNFVVSRLQQNITTAREAGVAEALLIGYRDNLDKDLVQAYSNTGVVHIIAISGLHLGMIYLVLVLLFKPFRRTKWARWVKPVIILTVLWLFTLIAGGVPSILRSAVMFSFIVLGETINRKGSIYNTLAASAFVMFCVNPYYLWDIGFQLSYAAVLSIVGFSKTIHNWIYVKNKFLDSLWSMTSVTLSAQILTTPIIFYSFHQFPNLFLFTNIVVVPLSTIILFAELAVLLTSFIPVVVHVVGAITTWLLAAMNNFIGWIDAFPFAVYDNIQNNMAETLVLYVVILSAYYWLLHKHNRAFILSLTALLVFASIDGVDTYLARQQQKVIVYNIPQCKAVDFIAGKQYCFVGDTSLLQDDYLKNFHLKPSRTVNEVAPVVTIDDLYASLPFVQYSNRRILLLDKPYKFISTNKIPLDVIVVSHNPRVRIADLNNSFDCAHYVFDGSNSAWKIKQWRKDCDSLHCNYSVTQDDGAFVLGM